MDRQRDFRTCLLLLVLTASSFGCASSGYRYGSASHYYTSQELADITGQQIERGKPRKFVDGFGWIWGIPSKIILWDRRMENHDIDAQTEAELAAYLQENELSSVKVRLNQYNPRDDWRRLVANKAVGPGWRYTLGAVLVAGETIFPGRLFGGDHYNPFTNTVHLYSNSPAIAWHEAGHAKDFARRKWKGTYAAAYLIPGVPLYHEAQATNDAISYVMATRDPAMQREAYNLLYPAYATYVGSAVSDPTGIAYVGAVLVGHAAGRWKSRQIPDLPPEARISQNRMPQPSNRISAQPSGSDAEPQTQQAVYSDSGYSQQ
ncbi:MAG: hypothetical protein JNM43_18325 [Planctomycetaceae bacterium]|nr:hypothetical protein [Planctomycetaceae bacterium]